LSKTTTMPDKIPLIDLAAQYAQIGPEIEAAMAEVIAANAFIGGPYLKNFQDEFTAYCGGTDYRGEELHTVGVSSGTAAWHLLLLAHGIGPGDEVIIPSHTFFATAEGIALTGAMPVFGEIDLDTYTLHPIAAEAMITPRTKAICAVHLYGRLADITGLRELADAHNLLLFEDAAQAHGAIHVSNQSDTTEPPIEAPQVASGNFADFPRAGGLADGAVFSFYPGKNLGAFGDAGAAVTPDPDIAARVRSLANHGRAAKYEHDTVGFNYRMDPLQAAILSVKLRHLDAWNDARRAAAHRYDALLADLAADDHLLRPSLDAGVGHVWHLYVIRTLQRDALRAHLAEQGIATGIHYPIPCHLQPALASHFQAEPGLLQATELAASQILSLPLYPELSEEQQQQVINNVG
jgi:dTDP-4-amino-4,6-dideoxygalactose transaminase